MVGFQLDQVPKSWLLQVRMGKSVEGVDPIALDLPVICQISVPASRGTFLLAWLQSGSQFD